MYYNDISGWWFGAFFIVPYIGNNHPNWLIFFRGFETTNQICLINQMETKAAKHGGAATMIRGWGSKLVSNLLKPDMNIPTWCLLKNRVPHSIDWLIMMFLMNEELVMENIHIKLSKIDQCSFSPLITVMAMATSYNWLCLWDYTFYKWGFLSTYNW